MTNINPNTKDSSAKVHFRRKDLLEIDQTEEAETKIGRFSIEKAQQHQKSGGRNMNRTVGLVGTAAIIIIIIVIASLT